MAHAPESREAQSARHESAHAVSDFYAFSNMAKSMGADMDEAGTTATQAVSALPVAVQEGGKTMSVLGANAVVPVPAAAPAAAPATDRR